MNYATPISLQRGFRVSQAVESFTANPSLEASITYLSLGKALHSSADAVVSRSLRSRIWQPTGGISQVVNEGIFKLYDIQAFARN